MRLCTASSNSADHDEARQEIENSQHSRQLVATAKEHPSKKLLQHFTCESFKKRQVVIKIFLDVDLAIECVN